MITYEKALRAVLAHAAPLPAQRVSLADALGAALAGPVRARADLPRFDQSSVDGFAVRAADLAGASRRTPRTLALVGTACAGERPRVRVRAGTAAKIFTGARIPHGADAVVMREDCEEHADHVRIVVAPRPGECIRRRGEEIVRGQTVLERATRVTPPVVGILASFGIAAVSVCARPRVAIVTTGNELCALGENRHGDRIYDSNAYALDSALAGLGITQRSMHRVPDNRKALARTLRRALGAHDLVLTVGGVSVGDRDYVKAALADLGVERVFWRVAMRPGMPTFFGVRPGRPRATLVFGLPGNPVSALVAFTTLASPALHAMMGACPPAPLLVPAVLRAPLRKNPGQIQWVRGVLAADKGGPAVTPCREQGSHMLSGLAGANCLIEFPHQAARLARGARVRVRVLPWSQ